MPLENIAYIALGWIAFGFSLIIVGIILLAKNQNYDYTTQMQGTNDNNIDKMEELFSFFLQEEEKKNEELRKAVTQKNMQSTPAQKDEAVIYKQQTSNIRAPKKNQQENTIITLYEEGNDIEDIAKRLKMGVGEIQLILSLYKMR